MKHAVRCVRRWVVLLVTGLFLAGCQTTPVGSERIEVTEFRPKTADGWELELKRFRLKGTGADTNRMPVILCHGRTSNGKSWDLTPELSFARYLAERGYDVWVPSLRGAGTSSKPGFHVLREMVRLRFDNSIQLLSVPTIANPARFNWTFDDYIFKDIPAIIDTVKSHTGCSKVMWVGHSLGGMIMLAYLEHADRDDVGAFVPIASPIYMPQPTNDLYQLLIDNPALFQMATVLINNQIPSTLSAFSIKKSETSFFYNPPNVDHKVHQKYLREGTEDTSTGVTEQMLDMLKTGTLKSADGKLDYVRDLHMIKTPILLIAGKADNMCEPACVRHVYERIGSTDKTYREFGVSNGHVADYGHGDFIMGKRAPQEVYPYIHRWLQKRDRPSK